MPSLQITSHTGYRAKVAQQHRCTRCRQRKMRCIQTQGKDSCANCALAGWKCIYQRAGSVEIRDILRRVMHKRGVQPLADYCQPLSSTPGYWADHGTLQRPNAVPSRHMSIRDISCSNRQSTIFEPLPGLKHSDCLDRRSAEVASDIVYCGNDDQCSMSDTSPLPSPSSLRSNTQKSFLQTLFSIPSGPEDNFSSTVKNTMYAPLSNVRDIPSEQEIDLPTSQSNLDKIRTIHN